MTRETITMAETAADHSSGGSADALLAGMVRQRLGLDQKDIGLGLAAAGRMLGRQPRAALRLYAALILCDPMNVDCQMGLAHCALLAEEPHLALQAASVVIALAPDDARGHLLSARASLALGATADARADLAAAAEAARRAGDAAALAEAGRLGAIAELAAQ
jgi:glucose dehydrogenase